METYMMSHGNWDYPTHGSLKYFMMISEYMLYDIFCLFFNKELHYRELLHEFSFHSV
jgi:hypothetical protein